MQVPIRTSAPRLLLLIAALLLAPCGGDGGETASTTSSSPTSPTSTTMQPGDEGPDTVAEPRMGEQTSPDGFPGEPDDTALLVDVRAAAHPGFDRVVFEFGTDEAPSYRVAPVEPPIRQDFSGHEVEVDGSAFLEVRFDRAAGFDPTSDDARRTYTGPGRITVAGGVVTELVALGDFEGQVAWVIGLRQAAPAAVAVLDDPVRVVVDVVEPDER